MSADRFAVLERFVPLLEAPEPSFEGFLRRRDRKRRNRRIAAGLVGAAFFAAAAWIATSGGPFEHHHVPASTGPTAPAYPGQVGLVGVAPEGATPSSPSRGELLVGFGFGHTGGDPGRFNLHLYADGRVVWQKIGEGYAGGDPTPTGLIEQRLTPEGVELVRSDVLSLGLFDRDRHLIGGYAPIHAGEIDVRDGDRLIRLSWGGIGDRAGREEVATPEQGQALKALDARLEDLASWLPAGAWEDPVMRAFVPSRYSVCYQTEQRVGFRGALAVLPRPAEDLLLTHDRTAYHIELPFGPTLRSWCSAVSADEARELERIIEAADTGDLVHVRRDVFGLNYSFDRREFGPVNPELSLEPMLPHES